MYYLKHDTILLTPFCFSDTEMLFTTGYKWLVRSTKKKKAEQLVIYDIVVLNDKSR